MTKHDVLYRFQISPTSLPKFQAEAAKVGGELTTIATAGQKYRSNLEPRDINVSSGYIGVQVRVLHESALAGICDLL